jgi:hypothetical protein
MESVTAPTKLLLLSILTEGSGNRTTIERIADCYRSSTCEVVLGDVESLPHADADEEREAMRKLDQTHSPTHVIGVHAWRAGRFTRFTAAPTAIILGGTDLNVYPDDAAVMSVMTAALEHCFAIVAFSDQMRWRALQLWPQFAHKLAVIAPAAAACTLCAGARVSDAPVDRFPSALIDGASRIGGNREPLKPGDITRGFVLMPTALRPVKAPQFALDEFSRRFSGSGPVLIIVGPVRNDAFAAACESCIWSGGGVDCALVVLSRLRQCAGVWYCGLVSMSVIAQLEHSPVSDPHARIHSV